MHKRYSVTLSGVFNGTPQTVSSLNFDLRTLIPESCRGKHLTVYSSFDTEDLGTTTHSGVVVQVNLPQTYNKQFPFLSQGVILGIADPIFCNTTQTNMKYMYNENNCFAKMIEYPDSSQIVITLTSTQGNNLTNAVAWILNLTFVEQSD